MSKSESAEFSSPSSAVTLPRRVHWLGLYVAALAAASFALLLSLVYLQFFSSLFLLPHLSIVGFVFFLALAVFADKYTVQIGRGAEVSAAFLAYFLSAALLGPLAAFTVGVVGQGLVFRRGQWERNVCFASAMGLSSGIAALVYWTIPATSASTATYLAIGGVVAGVEGMDLQLGRLRTAIEKAGGIMVLTADHGNSDDMYEHDKKTGTVLRKADGSPRAKTSHSLNPVPCVIFDPASKGEYKAKLREGLGISSLAATCIELLGYIAPADYDASVLAFEK